MSSGYTLTLADIGITNAATYIATTTPSLTTFVVGFGNMGQGFYEVLFSNFSTGEYYLGYVRYYNSTNAMFVTNQVASGITLTAVSPNITFNGLTVSTRYALTIRNVGLLLL